MSLVSESPAPSSPRSVSTMTGNSRVPSTPPSSVPPPDDETAEMEQPEDPVKDEELEDHMAQLSDVLRRVSAYSAMLKQEMDRVKISKPRQRAAEGNGEASTSSDKAPTKKRSHDDAGDDDPSTKRVKVDETTERKEPSAFLQPALITGATLKDYQLEGVAWMAGLYKNGISGILADEMGLGKTLQTIAFHAWLRQRTPAPFLVVCPLSVLNNWVNEFHRFAPEIPVCMYHGSPEERAEIRRTQMVFSESDMAWQNGKKTGKSGVSSSTPKKSGKGRPARRKVRPLPTRDSEDAVTPSSRPSEDGPPVATDTDKPLPPHQKTNFPVVITTYEMIIKDRVHLLNYRWGFIIVDEGHRLKNLDCKLMREIKQLRAESRMVLTGTPLHNNLAELWTLFNFVMPAIFANLDSFQEWFDLPTLQSTLSVTRSSQIINTLHSILRPFLLRRLKVDVETNLPPKKEYVLYAPLTEQQRTLYDAIVGGGLRDLLVKQAGERAGIDDQDSDVDLPLQSAIKRRGKRREGLRNMNKRDYLIGDDEEYFAKMESGELYHETQRQKNLKSAEELGREWQYKSALKKVNNMKLQNTVMQLRKVCSHPFLFDWPLDPETRQPIISDELVSASGKMMVLNRLLDELFSRKHKVLLFSQFTTMLDIIEDWAINFKGWELCRIDGSTSMADRAEQVSRFQDGGDDPQAPRLFLLSTRAGGLGLNLVAADTVIFYDQDWNPQMDLQAQDRAHRIGQTKPVLIFRLATAHTVETKIMHRATEKRKLEALVIAKGKFKAPTMRNKPETMAEMAASLLKLEGEQIQVVPNTAAGQASVISDEDLDALLDRRPEVFTDRGKGWTSIGGDAASDKEARPVKTTFAVYDAPVDEGPDVLAGMLSENLDEES